MELDFRKDPKVLAAIVDAMADGVFTVDAHGVFVGWSEGAERITGFRAAEVVGKPCTLLQGPNCRGFATLADLLAAPENAPAICEQECKFLSRDGRELLLHGNVRLLKDEHGAATGAVGTFSDLTSFVAANEKIAILEEQAGRRDAFGKMVGKSPPMQEIFRRLRLAAQSDVTVLLTGESGTGKELAARAIHELSQRKNGPFIAVNCSAIPETLLESELFGYMKGAFTGAGKDKTGLFEAADKGTIFLDEIGDVSPMIQVKLLRVLQEREVRRLGDERTRKIDVRVVTATNRDLTADLKSGAIRDDFYYRIRVFEIALPPLRQRREDIPLLAEHFRKELAATMKRPVSGFAKEAMSRLQAHNWPGNIRELRNAIEHALVNARSDRIRLLDLPVEVRPRPQAGPGRPVEHVGDEERHRIQEAIASAGGNKAEAARTLGWSRVTLWKKLKKMGLEPEAQR